MLIKIVASGGFEFGVWSTRVLAFSVLESFQLRMYS